MLLNVALLVQNKLHERNKLFGHMSPNRVEINKTTTTHNRNVHHEISKENNNKERRIRMSEIRRFSRRSTS